MTTYLLLAFDDGRVTVRKWEPHESCNPWPVEPLAPVRVGHDRNEYTTWEVGGYSIDVVRLPDTSGICDEPHPFLTGVSCRMPSDHVLRGQNHIGKGHIWAV